jgi:hypothetical protein
MPALQFKEVIEIMPEQEYDLRPVGVRYVCDKCGVGVMTPTGTMLCSYPPQWPHKCDHCGIIENMQEKYPTVRYRMPAGL